MNVETISMPRYAALSAYRDYKAAAKTATDERRRAEDELAARAYLAAARGRRILDLHGAMRTAGLFPSGFPKLAICRADVVRCRVRMRKNGSAVFWNDGGNDPDWGHRRPHRYHVTLPQHIFPADLQRNRSEAVALLPSIPPALRPKHDLTRYHILWEAVWEVAAPVDPMLLTHLGEGLYAVLVAWELTPIEQAVLRGRL